MTFYKSKAFYFLYVFFQSWYSIIWETLTTLRSSGALCTQMRHLRDGEVKVKVAQYCQTLWDPMDSTVHAILQARILEWVAFPFSRGSSQPRDGTQISHIAGGFFPSWATREAQTHSVEEKRSWAASLPLNPHSKGRPSARVSMDCSPWGRACTQWGHPSLSGAALSSRGLFRCFPPFHLLLLLLRACGH